MTINNAHINGTMIPFEDITARSPEYLWQPYLIKNNINLIYGDGGTGKSMLVAALFSAITHGMLTVGMPGEAVCGPSNVIYFGAEDDLENYRHRLDLCGCDSSKVFTCNPPNMPKLDEIKSIHDHIVKTRAKLLVFDPIQAFLPSGLDMNMASDVRPVMDRLRTVCQETQCTLLLVGHINKAYKAKAAHRSVGSADFINASRSALLVGYHKDKDDIRVVAHVKSNAQYGLPIQFKISDQGQLSWLGNCNLSEEDIANAPRTKGKNTTETDPLLEMINRLMDENPDGWQGTTTQLLEAGKLLADCSLIANPRSIGKRLPSISPSLRKHGICWTKASSNQGTIHRFSKAQDMVS